MGRRKTECLKVTCYVGSSLLEKNTPGYRVLVEGCRVKEEKDKPVAYDAYEAMADSYAAQIDTKIYNAYIERPTTQSLLHDVKDKHALDAGCGPGIYSEWLINNGATVVAVDASTKMIEYARERLGEDVPLYLANLEKPLDFLEDDLFDFVVSALVPDYILDWHALFTEFSRVLKKDGVVVFSVEHPYTKRLLVDADDYFKTEKLVINWPSFGIDVPTYRRPLTAMVESLVDTGFIIENIKESFPTEKVRELEPETYEKTSKNPTFLSFRARKR
jgi:ubiquinone/menaquinone biosynthesis C-methylase UbiE